MGPPGKISAYPGLGQVPHRGIRLPICFLLLMLWPVVSTRASDPTSWPGADLFSKGTVPRLRVELTPPALDALRREPREFVEATVREGTNVYARVGLHLKGSTGSFRPVDDRPALTLDFCQFVEGRKFHGLRRVHLNNSVEDPARANERIGAEVFQAAGLPAPRVTRALVSLDGRELGLYVLKEGFTEDFLACHFKQVGGDLFEPEAGHDVDARFKRNSVRAPSQGRAALRALAAAAAEPDLKRRWQRLGDALDLDRFVAFMALEVMLGHRDGYCLARNNFRVYHDLDSGKIVFLPHGMDQLLGTPDLPWQPHFGGLVAQALMETDEGKARYAERFHELFTNVFHADALAGRVEELAGEVRPLLNHAEWAAVREESDRVKTRLLLRQASLRAQLSRPPMKLVEFTAGMAHLSGWEPFGRSQAAVLERGQSPDGRTALALTAKGEISASWRTRVRLAPGPYRFQARSRVAGVSPLPYGTHQGAGLRVAGTNRQGEELLGTTEWRPLGADFLVGPEAAEVEFICELRAAAGTAWFDEESLRLTRIP